MKGEIQSVPFGRREKDGQSGFVMEYLSHFVHSVSSSRRIHNTQPSLEKSLIRIG